MWQSWSLTSIWLIVPAFRRYAVSRVAFAGLAWALQQVDGQAVVIADDANLDLAREHGLHAIKRPNQPLGRKWNDGYTYAADHGADYLIPCGSDDWIHPDFLAQLPEPGEIRACRYDTVVNEGRQIGHFEIDYAGGPGIRIFRRDMLAPLGFRPAADNRDRVIDGSIMDAMREAGIAPTYRYSDDPLSIVQFNTGEQITSWAGMVRRFRRHVVHDDPWVRLAERWPAELVEKARALYA